MPFARRIGLWAAAALYVGAGALHFLKTGIYLKIMPPYVPWHEAMVYLSGAAEMAGGIGLLIPRLRRAAGWGLAALLVAVFPANLYMAMEGARVAGGVPAWVLWGRLPLQAVLIWWVLWCSRDKAVASS